MLRSLLASLVVLALGAGPAAATVDRGSDPVRCVPGRCSPVFGGPDDGRRVLVLTKFDRARPRTW